MFRTKTFVLCTLGLLTFCAPCSGFYSGRICAFMDANFDRYTDLLLVAPKKLYILIASGKDRNFNSNDAYEILLPPSVESQNIINCGFGDFDGNANLDLLLTIVKDKEFSIFICLGSASGRINCSQSTKHWTSSTDGIAGQPTIGDFNVDTLNDFFIPLKNGSTLCVLGEKSSPGFKQEICLSSSVKPEFMHGYADLNGDLNADIIMGVRANSTEETGLEIWRKSGPELDWTLSHSLFPLASRKKLFQTKEKTNPVGYLLLEDFNADGFIDIILPTCKNASCVELELLIYSESMDVGTWITRDLSFIESVQSMWKVSFLDEPHFHMRVGDFTLDGYPELLIMLEPSTGKGNPTAFVIQNVPCSSNCELWNRDFGVVWNPKYTSPADTTLTNVAFFDLEEDGNLDILYEYKEKDGTYKVDFWVSSDKGDTSFLKVQAYTSTCSTKCRTNKKSEGSGIPAAGATILFEIIDEEGLRIHGSHSQLAQSSYGALLLPYALFGLGRTPNFVEKMTVGIPSWDPIKNKTWEQIVPNSRLYVIPWGYTNQWISRLYLTPSRLILLSFAALCCICGVIMLLIVILYWKERRQDKIEKEQESHKFHFDAM